MRTRCLSDEVLSYTLDYPSPHSEVLRHILPRSRVLDLGCAGGYVGVLLKERLGCDVTGVDCFPLASGNTLAAFIEHDLNVGLPALDLGQFDYILLLDVIEHLVSPEKFIQSLRRGLEQHPEVTVIASSGNVGFFVTRLMLLLGQFNYGKRGILDMTHSRLFTFSSFRRLFVQNGFREVFVTGIPGPFPMALGENLFGKVLLKINSQLIRIRKGLFSYQIFLVSKSMPSLEYLLAHSIKQSEIRARL